MPLHKQRTEIEIEVDILRAALQNDLFTHLLYKANLSFKMADAKIPNLVRNGLLEQVKDSDGWTYYRTTVQGIDVISAYDEFIEKYKRAIGIIT